MMSFLSSFKSKPLPKLGALLRKNFLAGLFILIPMGVIFWILGVALGSLWQLQYLFPASWQADQFFADTGLVLLFKLGFTIATIVGFALAVSFVGWFSKLYFGQKFLEIFAELIQRIPVVRSVYSALDQLLKTLASGSSQQFSRVVFVEYPRKECWTLGFVTGQIKGFEKHLSVFVPTTPNPTSGFFLIVPESDIRESNMKTEDAFKLILSFGFAGGGSAGNGGSSGSPPQ